ncbi:unnamed protein product [[Candida] boidinii]|nr:unnamed protein product [[Candida] boidinii]
MLIHHQNLQQQLVLNYLLFHSLQTQSPVDQNSNSNNNTSSNTNTTTTTTTTTTNNNNQSIGSPIYHQQYTNSPSQQQQGLLNNQPQKFQLPSINFPNNDNNNTNTTTNNTATIVSPINSNSPSTPANSNINLNLSNSPHSIKLPSLSNISNQQQQQQQQPVSATTATTTASSSSPSQLPSIASLSNQIQPHQQSQSQPLTNVQQQQQQQQKQKTNQDIIPHQQYQQQYQQQFSVKPKNEEKVKKEQKKRRSKKDKQLSPPSSSSTPDQQQQQQQQDTIESNEPKTKSRQGRKPKNQSTATTILQTTITPIPTSGNNILQQGNSTTILEDADNTTLDQSNYELMRQNPIADSTNLSVVNGDSTILNESTIIDFNNTTTLPQQQQQQQQHNHHQIDVLPKQETPVKTNNNNSNKTSNSKKNINRYNDHNNNSHNNTNNNTVTTDFKRRKITINSFGLLKDTLKFPRLHLGSIIYQEYPTYSTILRFLKNLNKDDEMILKQENDEIKSNISLNSSNSSSLRRRNNLQRTELLPSILSNYINCLIDIHIPHNLIKSNSNVKNRRIWGTDIYTDDSDILSILFHCGIIRSKDIIKSYDEIMHGQIINSNTYGGSANSSANNTGTGNGNVSSSLGNTSTSTSNINNNKKRNEELKYLKQIPIEIINNNTGEIEFNSITKPITPGNINNRYNININNNNNISNNEELDLIVTLIILPTLKEYQGTFRNNYNSRTWNKINHNGYSISVFKVNWCNLNNSIDKINSIELNKKIINENIKNFKELKKNGIEIDIDIKDQEEAKAKQNEEEEEEDKKQENDKREEEIGNWCQDKNYWRKSVVNN